MQLDPKMHFRLQEEELARSVRQAALERDAQRRTEAIADQDDQPRHRALEPFGFLSRNRARAGA